MLPLPSLDDWVEDEPEQGTREPKLRWRDVPLFDRSTLACVDDDEYRELNFD